MRAFVASMFMLVIFTCSGQTQMYYVKVVRAAPGELLSLIEMMKSDLQNHESLGIQRPFLMRHSQGDQWDLLWMHPVPTAAAYFGEGLDQSQTLQKPYGSALNDKISFQEEGFFYGPEEEEFNRWMRQYSYYHVEIFTALAGQQQMLAEERKMENVYLEALGRRPNFIFTRAFGTSWDIFTIGCYDDIEDFAQSGSIPLADEDAAAKKAGFESVFTIGSDLRKLILEHHDTLAGAVRP